MNVQDSRSRGGTGLGLAIVKHIVNRHRGRLVITSELGKGSTFMMKLPVKGQLLRPSSREGRDPASLLRDRKRDPGLRRDDGIIFIIFQ